MLGLLKNQLFISQHSRGTLIFVHKGHVVTLTSDCVPDQNASSSRSVPNATEQDRTSISATIPVHRQQIVLYPQLHKATFKPATPIKYKVLDRLLQEHPNREKVEYVVRGFQFGFSLKYKGLLENRQPKNLLLAYQHSEKLWASLMKEVHLGQMLGPFPVQPIDPLICSPVGMVEK